MTKETMFARIKPHTTRSHRVKSYTVKGARFRLIKGWYKVTLKMAKRLKGKRADSNDPQSPRVFDVCTKAQAILIEKREEERKRVRDDPFSVSRVTKGRDDVEEPKEGPKEEPWPEDDEEDDEDELLNELAKDAEWTDEPIPFPIAKYDHMNVQSAALALNDLDARQLAIVKKHEEDNKKRIGVLSVIDDMLEGL